MEPFAYAKTPGKQGFFICHRPRPPNEHTYIYKCRSWIFSKFANWLGTLFRNYCLWGNYREMPCLTSLLTRPPQSGMQATAAATVTVALDDTEYLHALIAGCLRRANARSRGRKNYYGAQSADAELLDMIGAVGEAVVAKHLNRFWAGAGVFRGGDVDRYQVRTTTYDYGHLLLNRNDSDDVPYILVCVNSGVGKIRGWVYGREGKKHEYWKDKSGRGAAFYVPQQHLRPISTLADDDF